MRPRLVVLLLVLLGCALGAGAAQYGTLRKAESLRAKPYIDAKAVMTLPAGAKVELLDRQGAWYRVKSGRKTGWVRMLNVATVASKPAAMAKAPATGRAGTGAVVATTGVRALNAGELATAVRNDTELARLDSYAVTETDAARFAAQGKLKAIKLDYLPAPEKTR